MVPPRNLAISSQMTIKLGKVILWVEIFIKLTKRFDDDDFMTSSKCES